MLKRENINLMPYQWDAINGDTHAQQGFLLLKGIYNLKNAVETGCCLGSTTEFMAKNFEKVYTAESNNKFLEFAKDRLKDFDNIDYYLGDSPNMIEAIGGSVGDKTLFFLDAHGFGNSSNPCPLLMELQAIAKCAIRPCIAIHDFMVPDEPKLGYDTYNKQPFTFEWIRPYLENIYGVDGYEYYYNSDEKSAGAKRGIIYIIPKQ